MCTLSERADKARIAAENLLRDIESKEKQKVYIAGPMSGLPNDNKGAF